MHLEKFVNSKSGRVLMSIILGLGLATIFRQACKGRRCRINLSPPMEDLDSNTYKIDGKCYAFEKNSVSCDRNKQTIKIA
jgi:hypothetical protein